LTTNQYFYSNTPLLRALYNKTVLLLGPPRFDPNQPILLYLGLAIRTKTTLCLSRGWSY